MKIGLTILLLILSSLAQAKILGESIVVNPHAIPGDSDATQLAVPGLQIHEMNDYFGETDKLMSGGGKASLMRAWKHFSTSLTFKGRFITPILQTRNDQPMLTEKIGVYAETVETSWNLSYTWYKRDSIGLKANLGLYYTDAGDHGLVNLYRQIHEAIGSPIQDSKFGDKQYESYKSMSYGAAVIFPVMDEVNFTLGTTVYNSRDFYEYALESSLIVSLSRNFALSMKYMFIDQKRSEWYNLTPSRQQYLLGIRFLEYLTPSLMYVSPYVEGDDYGQLYLSPISFTYPF